MAQRESFVHLEDAVFSAGSMPSPHSNHHLHMCMDAPRARFQLGTQSKTALTLQKAFAFPNTQVRWAKQPQERYAIAFAFSQLGRSEPEGALVPRIKHGGDAVVAVQGLL
jgi:hypothetical protein